MLNLAYAMLFLILAKVLHTTNAKVSVAEIEIANLKYIELCGGIYESSNDNQLTLNLNSFHFRHFFIFCCYCMHDAAFFLIGK